MRIGFPIPSKMLAALLGLSLVLGACGDDETVVEDPAAPGVSIRAPLDVGTPLDGRSFWSVSVLENGAEHPLFTGTQIVLSFTNGIIAASAGCNLMSGWYQINDKQLIITELASTEIGCDPERHAQDEFIAAALNAGPQLTLNGHDLTLATDTVRIQLLNTMIADPDRPILQTRWVVTGFIQGEVSITMSVEPGREGWIEFSEDSQLTGFDGCVDFSAPATLSEGEIQFGEVTSEDCVEPSSYREAFNMLFETGKAAFSINGPRLTLLNSQDNGVTFIADE
ncbi:MAG: META domain-containing protein [Acidimicrobiaceae bacterium]|nr:META domain-containing protein [Acidimicrobiaceae bacterium]